MISPIRYVQSRQKELLSGITSESADTILTDGVDAAKTIVRIVGMVPKGIPTILHEQITRKLITAYVNQLFAMSSYEYRFDEKDGLLWRSLNIALNHRERS